MRQFFFSLLACCSFNLSADLWIQNAEEITEEFLIKTSASCHYTEHVAHLKQVFTHMPVKGFLEFGVGFSTKYFIDQCEKVISVEFVTPGSGPDWLKYCLDLYHNYPNWTPIAYFSGNGLETDWAPNKYMGIESVYKAAAYQPVTRKSYAPIDSSFLEDFHQFIVAQTVENQIDVAFVDCGICLRGDLVQSLFNHVPIIAAHDVGRKEVRYLDDVYGYGRIEVPENYVEIYVQKGMGTAFWIKNEFQYASLIEKLNNYALVDNQ
ncbi:MAG TPA: hypothetical protein PLC42_07100 [Parachlamydiaceae bacterium]|nr:hypothetical protein [Parachlamydiaceae bacterium]